MFGTAETGSGEALKKCGSVLITITTAIKRKAGYSMCNVLHQRQTKQTNMGFNILNSEYSCL